LKKFSVNEMKQSHFAFLVGISCAKLEQHSLNSLDFTLGVAAVGAQALKKRRRQRSVRDLRPLLVLLPAESRVLNQPNRKSSTTTTLFIPALCCL
jgi:hypothetical protein